jgi:hypothetical protein
MSTHNCSYCGLIGHTINDCAHPYIEETWKYILGGIPFHSPPELSTYLQESYGAIDHYLSIILENQLLYAIGIQYGNGQITDTEEEQVYNVMNRIFTEIERFETMNQEEQREFLAWLYETNGENLGMVFNQEGEGEEQEEEQEQEEQEEQEKKPILIEPVILCLETASELCELFECSICLDEKKIISQNTTNCQHSFCHECICRHIDTSKNGSSCPLCRTQITSIEVKDMEHYENIRQKYNIQEKEEEQGQGEQIEEQQQTDYFDMLYDSWIISQPIGDNILLEPILLVEIV